MPPKKKPAAPANRVYKSSTPLQQSRFPLKTTRVKYGKQASQKAQKQETLTQMDFVRDQLYLEDNDEALGIYKDETEKPKKKRRKTTGDEPSSESKYHTQTITQLDWSFTSELEADDSIYDIHNSSPQSKKRRKDAIENAKPQKPAIQRSSRRKSAPGSMAPPQTPHRSRTQEIPSSESPATPPSRNSPLKGSLLKERSINIPIPFITDPKPVSSPSKLSKPRVEDTFESEDISQITRIPTTPSKRSSPAKSVRWAETDEIHEIVEVDPTPQIVEETQSVATTKPPTQLRDEILDSEDDGGDYVESEDDPSEEDKEELQPETCYGEIDLETQKLLESQGRPASPCIEESQILGDEMQEEMVEETHHVVASQILGEEIPEDLAEEQTQYMESQRLATQHMHAMAPRTKVSDVFLSIQPQNVTKIVERTRNHDFRKQIIPDTVSRIWIYETSPTRVLQYMAVISPAKRPGEIMNEDGLGNAEFNAKDPNCGELAWEILELHELADPLPWDTIKSNEWLNDPPKRPTFVRPAVLDQLMANLKPPIFCRAPLIPELPGSSSADTQEAEEQLLSTMIQYTQQPPFKEVFSSQFIKEEDEVEDEDDEDFIHYRPQELSRAASIPSNLYSSQFIKPEDADDEDESPQPTPAALSQASMPPPKEHRTQWSLPELQRPSQAETVDLSQSQTPRHQAAAEIVFESPTRPIFSSTPISLPTPRGREHVGPDSLIPYSMSSSQLLMKSQMLPESLLNDSVPGPPLFIQNSDDEDEL